MSDLKFMKIILVQKVSVRLKKESTKIRNKTTPHPKKLKPIKTKTNNNKHSAPPTKPPPPLPKEVSFSDERHLIPEPKSPGKFPTFKSNALI